jgi:replicative DNA helicase
MNGKASPIQIRQMEDAADRARLLPLAVNDKSALKVADMHRWARRLDREFRHGGRKLDALVVDYLQLARPEKDRKGNKVQEVTDISADLLALAKDLDIALIALSQLSRAPEQRGNPRPQLSDLRDSGSLEQDADMVGMLFRPAYYLERKAKEEELSPEEIKEAAANKFRLEVDWQKNRNGKTGVTLMFCDIGRNAVGDRAPEFRSVAA